jgi:hypothetical protein
MIRSMEAANTLVPAHLSKANSTTISTQMDSILDVAALLEKGTRGTTDIMKATGLSRMTVIKYRNEAMKLLHAENKSFNTEAMRNMEIGRLHHWIDKLQDEINGLHGEDDRDYKVKLLGRLDSFQGRLHSITGLNTTVNVNYEEKKRITFVMNAADKPKPEAITINQPETLPSVPASE